MTAFEATSEAGPRVRAFVLRLRRARATSAAQAMAWHVGLPLAALALFGLLVLPRVSWLVFACVVFCLVFVIVLAATIAWLQAQAVKLHELVNGLAAAGRVHPGVLADELETWLEHGHGEGEPMAEWLGAVIDGDVAAVPVPAVRGLGRRRLGRVRYLLPLCIVLLLAWLLRFWAPPVWGLGGMLSGPGGVAPGKGEGKGESPSPQVAAGPKPSLPPLPEEPPPEKDDPPPPVQPEPPAPVLPLPLDREFVVPQFIDDGPSRRELAHVAELPQGEAGAQAQGQRTGGGAEKGADAQKTDFARAEERALRARHVPEAERPMVQRFFARLREGKK